MPDPEITVTEPFPAFLWPVVWDWLQRARSFACDDFSPKDAEEFVEYSDRLMRSGRIMAVRAAGDICGAVSFELTSPAMAIMHVLFSPRFRGRKKTLQAGRMACDLLFRTSTTQKVLGLVPENNRLAITLAVAAGGTIEGVLRSHTTRWGAPVNAVAVGITKEEFYGTESERIEVERDQLAVELADIFGRAGGDPGRAVEPAIDAVAGRDQRRNLAERAGDGDRRGQRDEHGVDGHGVTDAKVSGGARVRAKRTVRPDESPDRARPAKLARSKRDGRGKQPARAK